MNYRHAFHAGNFADVLKHAVLAFCLEHLKRKDKPFRVIDTHAGIAAYDLDADEARRSPEWRDGVGRLFGAEVPQAARPALAPWLEALKAANLGGALTAYPGSPAITRAALREADALRLCELHPADAAALTTWAGRDARVKVEARDGYAALKAYLPPPERRGLVLIDPPFETKDEFERLAAALADAWRRWPTGTYVVWRPLKDLGAAAAFDLALWDLVGEDDEAFVRLDVWTRALGAPGALAGAGVVVLNPPFTLAPAFAAALPWLSATLAQGDGAGWRADRP